MKILIPEYVKAAIQALKSNGYSAYIVGGCVRDSIIGKLPLDWDVCTNALPQQMKNVFASFNYIETGLKHGTITVVIDRHNIEITTFRIDGEYSDGRHPDKVLFVSDLKKDLLRRDFTINAMAYSDEEGLIDFFDGKQDISDRIIRCVGDADRRFSEDALRILRAVRFSSVLGFEVEDKTAESIIQNKELLNSVSSERIQTELNKLILGDNVRKSLSDFREVIAVFIPEIKQTFDFEQKNPHHHLKVFDHIIKSVECSEKILEVRLTMLFHDIAKPQCFTIDSQNVGHFRGHPKISSEIAKRVLKRLKYPTKTIELVTFLVLEHDTRELLSSRAVKKMLNRYGEEFFRLQSAVRRADSMAQSPKFLSQSLSKIKESEAIADEVIKNQQCFSLSTLEVSGKMLIDAGIPSGKTMGEILKKLLELVITEQLANDKQKLLNKAIEIYQNDGE